MTRYYVEAAACVAGVIAYNVATWGFGWEPHVAWWFLSLLLSIRLIRISFILKAEEDQ